MTAYILCMKHPGETRWSVIGTLFSREVAEVGFKLEAASRPAALSRLEIPEGGTLLAALDAAGADATARVDEPPGEVLMRSGG